MVEDARIATGKSWYRGKGSSVHHESVEGGVLNVLDAFGALFFLLLLDAPDLLADSYLLAKDLVLLGPILLEALLAEVLVLAGCLLQLPHRPLLVYRIRVPEDRPALLLQPPIDLSLGVELPHLAGIGRNTWGKQPQDLEFVSRGHLLLVEQLEGFQVAQEAGLVVDVDANGIVLEGNHREAFGELPGLELLDLVVAEVEAGEAGEVAEVLDGVDLVAVEGEVLQPEQVVEALDFEDAVLGGEGGTCCR